MNVCSISRMKSLAPICISIASCARGCKTSSTAALTASWMGSLMTARPPRRDPLSWDSPSQYTGLAVFGSRRASEFSCLSLKTLVSLALRATLCVSTVTRNRRVNGGISMEKPQKCALDAASICVIYMTHYHQTPEMCRVGSFLREDKDHANFTYQPAAAAHQRPRLAA